MNYPASHRRVLLPASFFLGNQLLAQGSIPRLEVVTFPQWNEALVCAVCSETWGRIAVDGSGWGFTRSFCPRHDPRSLPDTRPFGYGVPPRPPGGSFLQSPTLEVESLPPPLLSYEFNLWSKLYEHASD